jgi:hypothetical protein
MEIPETLIIVVTMILSIISFSSTFIGLQFFKQNEIDMNIVSVKNLPVRNVKSYKSIYPFDFNFLIINLVVSIVVFILTCIAVFLKFRN